MGHYMCEKEDRRSSLEILLTRDTDNTRAHFIFFERERFLGMSSVWKNVFCYLTKYFIALPPTIYAKWLGDVRCAMCDMRNAMCVLSPISSGAAEPRLLLCILFTKHKHSTSDLIIAIQPRQHVSLARGKNGDMRMVRDAHMAICNTHLHILAAHGKAHGADMYFRTFIYV